MTCEVGRGFAGPINDHLLAYGTFHLSYQRSTTVLHSVAMA